jgi:hypothetical protein
LLHLSAPTTTTGALPGQTVEFLLKIANNAYESVRQIELRLTLPAGVELDPESISAGWKEANLASTAYVYTQDELPTATSLDIAVRFKIANDMAPGSTLRIDVHAQGMLERSLEEEDMNLDINVEQSGAVYLPLVMR